MLIQKAVKVQIYPRESDKELLAKHFGVRRFIMSGLGTKSDTKQKRMEASGSKRSL